MGLAVVLAGIAYVGLCAVGLTYVYRFVVAKSKRRIVGAFLALGLGLALLLLPNDAWKGIPASFAMPQLCARDAGWKILKVIPEVDGLMYLSYDKDGNLPVEGQGSPGEYWLKASGYDFVEWKDRASTWRLEFRNPKPVRVTTQRARYAQTSRHKNVSQNIFENEYLVTDLATGEVLAYFRSVWYSSGLHSPSAIGWGALLPQALFFSALPLPSVECRVEQKGDLIRDTLRPKAKK
jgi:hypothetical protein